MLNNNLKSKTKHSYPQDKDSKLVVERIKRVIMTLFFPKLVNLNSIENDWTIFKNLLLAKKIKNKPV